MSLDAPYLHRPTVDAYELVQVLHAKGVLTDEEVAGLVKDGPAILEPGQGGAC